MRILFISHFSPLTHNTGTENYTLGLAQALKSRGHEVLVLCAEDWDSGHRYWNGVSREIYCGIPVHQLHLNWTKAANPNLVLYDSPPVERWLDSFLIETNPQIIHVTSTYSLGVGTLRSAQKAGIPTVLTLMDFWFLCPRTTLMKGDGKLCDGMTSSWECQKCLLSYSDTYQKFNRFFPDGLKSAFYRFASLMPKIQQVNGVRGIALNINHRKRLLKHALDIPDLILSHSLFLKRVFKQTEMASSIIHLANGHDLEWLQNFQPGTGNGCLRFGYIGQINSTKGVHVLLEAFLKLKKTQEARLDIWGDTEVHSDYIRTIRELAANSDSIKLRGRFQHKRLGDVLSEIDVLVVPSLWYENAPLVIQEAFSVRIPVIATDLGGMSEAVTHGVNGLLFNRGDSEDLSGKLGQILDEPALLEKLKAGIPPVKTFHEEASELELVYKDLAIGILD